MSWLDKVLGRKRSRGDLELVELRTTRFRQLLRCYGAILDLTADAAEKQGGDYILDRQYVISLSERALDLADSVLFDLSVMAGNRFGELQTLLDRLRAAARDTVSRPLGDRPEGSAGRAGPLAAGGGSTPAALAGVLARAETLYRSAGVVACRGIAAGPVVHATPDGLGALPSGYVLVAPDEDRISGHPDLLRGAAAVLLDRGATTGAIASAARRLRVPTIVGIGDASVRLGAGEVVTVDADEGSVYRGRIDLLLDYYRDQDLGGDDEPEYRVLREIRRALFPLTLAPGEPARAASCVSLVDIVHFAHLEAGAALASLVAGYPDAGELGVAVEAGGGSRLRVFDLGGAVAPAAAGQPSDGAHDLRNRALAAFADGLAGAAAGALVEARSAATEEHAFVAVAGAGGPFVVDATVAADRKLNHLYLRCGSETALGDPAMVRAGGVVTVWRTAVPAEDIEAALRVAGRLAASAPAGVAAGDHGQARFRTADTEAGR